MSSIKQNIRSVLADVESFLVETLKSVKLNSGARDQKDRLLERIRLLLEEIPGSASSQLDSSASGGSLKISGGGDSGSGGTSSSNLQTVGDDDSGYADNIPKKAASELKNKLQTGMLEKKKKTGFKTWDALYCVVSGNVFYMYKKLGDSKQKEAFCLSGYECHEAPGLEKDTSKKEMCFEVTKAGAPTYQFRAGSKEGMVIWKEAITKGIQIATDEEPGEVYEDIGQDQDSGGDFPPPPPASAFDDPEDIYEECGDNQELEAMASTPTFKPTRPPSQPLEAPDEMYDDCASSAVDTAKPGEKKSEPPPPPPPGRRRDPPVIPPPTSDPFPPPPPPPKSELPPVPTCLPPPIPDRKGGTADAPPLPSNPPPLPGRSGAGVRVPQLRKPFMDRDEDFENVYYSKWDCSADTGKELGFKQGDTIHVLSRDFDAESWWVGELDGKVGLVPKEYLCPAFQLVP